MENVYLCVNPVVHTIHLRGSNGHGWNSYSKVILSYNGTSESFYLYEWEYEDKQSFDIAFMLIASPIPHCSEDQSLILLRRKCNRYKKIGEIFELYEGISTSEQDKMIYNQSDCTSGGVYLCVNPVFHTFILRGPEENGWQSGSYVILSH